MRKEYDFSQGIRGKYSVRFKEKMQKIAWRTLKQSPTFARISERDFRKHFSEIHDQINSQDLGLA